MNFILDFARFFITSLKLRGKKRFFKVEDLATPFPKVYFQRCILKGTYILLVP